MKKTLAMVLAAGMVATMLGGCSSGGSSTPADNSGSRRNDTGSFKHSSER